MLGGVELNLAAMLDMAFQLLMFFILTFNVAPIESQIALRLPLPTPVTRVDQQQQAGASLSQDSPPSASGFVVVTALATPAGQIKNLAVGETIVADPSKLSNALHDLIAKSSPGVEQAVIQVDAGLCYQELLKVVEACTQQNLPNGGSLSKLRLVELRTE